MWENAKKKEALEGLDYFVLANFISISSIFFLNVRLEVKMFKNIFFFEMNI